MADPAPLLSPLTKPDATNETITSTVQTLTDQAKASAASIGDYLWDTFNAVFDAAGQTAPEHQHKLVELLSQLRQITATDADGQPLKYEGGVVWRDLPSFGWVARDRWNFDVLDSSATQEERSKWENWAAFLAQLTARAKADDPQDPFDFSVYALWAMRTAFEETHPEEPSAGSASASASAVKHAAVWVRYGGPRLRKLCAEGRTLDGNMGAARGKYADRGWKGFDEERWKVWKEEFKAAKGRGVADGTAWEAAEVMDSL